MVAPGKCRTTQPGIAVSFSLRSFSSPSMKPLLTWTFNLTLVSCFRPPDLPVPEMPRSFPPAEEGRTTEIFRPGVPWLAGPLWHAGVALNLHLV